MKPVTIETLPHATSTDSLSMSVVLVPCRVNFVTGLFEPLITIREAWPHIESVLPDPKEETKHKTGLKTARWSEEEDERLIEHVEKFGKHSWSQISRELNSVFHVGKTARFGKHCRERWYNHLDPELKSTFHAGCRWSPSEDELLVSLYAAHGSCWSKIARCITGRTENHVKNRWNSLIKKARRKIANPCFTGSAVARLIQVMKDEVKQEVSSPSEVHTRDEAM